VPTTFQAAQGVGASASEVDVTVDAGTVLVASTKKVVDVSDVEG